MIAGVGARVGSVEPLDRGAEFVSSLESTSRRIQDPVAKLRFIRGSLARYCWLDRVIRAVPFAPLRRRLYGWLGLEGLRYLLTANSLGGVAPRQTAPRTRATSLAGLAAVAAVVAAAGSYRASRPASDAALPLAVAQRGLLTTSSAAGQPAVAEALPSVS